MNNNQINGEVVCIQKGEYGYELKVNIPYIKEPRYTMDFMVDFMKNLLSKDIPESLKKSAIKKFQPSAEDKDVFMFIDWRLRGYIQKEFEQTDAYKKAQQEMEELNDQMQLGKIILIGG